MLNETRGGEWQMPFNDFAGRYFNICFVLAVNSLKMRRRMIEEVHPNGDAIKPRMVGIVQNPPHPFALKR